VNAKAKKRKRCLNRRTKNFNNAYRKDSVKSKKKAKNTEIELTQNKKGDRRTNACCEK
jgi:hypothetical protein